MPGRGDESDRGYPCRDGMKSANMIKINKNGMKSVLY